MTAASLRSRIQKLLELIEDQFAAPVDRSHAQPRALFFTEDLPRHDIRVMLHARDQNFIARTHLSAAVGLRDEVNRFGGASHENDFFGRRGIQEGLHRAARGFMLPRGKFGEEMHAAVDVGVFVFVIVAEGVDHHLRLLRGSRVVQIHERLAANSSAAGSENRRGFSRRRSRRPRILPRAAGTMLSRSLCSLFAAVVIRLPPSSARLPCRALRVR